MKDLRTHFFDKHKVDTPIRVNKTAVTNKPFVVERFLQCNH